MAVPTIVDSQTTVSTGNGTSLSLTTPSGALAGHLLLALVAFDGNPTSIAISGWSTAITITQTSTVTVALTYLHSSGTPDANYSITWTGNQKASGGIVAISGHLSSNPVHVSQTSTSTANSNFTPTGITTTVDDCLVFSLVGADRYTITTTPSTNETTLWNVGDGTAVHDVQCGVAHQSIATAGGSSHDQWSVSPETEEWAGIVAAIRAPGDTSGGGPARHYLRLMGM